MQTNNFTHDLAEIQVSYKPNVKNSERRQIVSSKDAEQALRAIWSDNLEMKETFYILLLNRANKVMGYYKVSEGGMTGTVADPKIIFSVALKGLACSLILAHNHPSGNSQPSDADIKLTKRLKQGGEVLEIPVLDHLILTTDGYYSFADEGMM